MKNESHDRGEFISRFMFHLRPGEKYWMTGTPPTPEAISEAAATARDQIGFDEHRPAFTLLAGIIDICNAEEVEAQGGGMAAWNASKHPLVISLGKLSKVERAAISVASAQGLAWMEDCRKWVRDATVRNQVAKRVMLSILQTAGRVNASYTSSQLASLIQVGESLRDNCSFVVRARGVIVEILAKNQARLVIETTTKVTLKNLLTRVKEQAGFTSELKAVQKLRASKRSQKKS